MRASRLTWIFALVVACGAPPGSSDAGPPDAHADGAIPDGGDAAASLCVHASDCDDGVYCNGLERCLAAGVAGADARGCAPASAPACASDARCDETRRLCLPGACTALDADGDGFASTACGGSDCDDADPDRHPGNAERCDAASPMHDEDCDPCTIASATTGDGDLDHDGSLAASCSNAFVGAAPTCDPSQVAVDASALVVHGLDCRDDDPNVHAGEPETCNGVDDDCNGLVDDGVLLTFFPDADGDGFGAIGSTPILACAIAAGEATSATDCDDADATRHPSANEICNARDDDCDGTVDEDATTLEYADADHDGHGDPTRSRTSSSCTPDAGFSLIGDDCDDTDPSTYAGALEICDGRDENCSSGGGADPSEDADGDGHAPPSAACSGGFPRDDCDDTLALTFLGALERCDGRDNDCDGLGDDVEADATAFCGTGASCDAGVCVDHVGLALGAAHTCAIRPDRSVACWGSDGGGQLGNGPGGSFLVDAPGAVVGLSDAVEIAAAATYACARHASGALSCWGTGMLGNGALGVTELDSPGAVVGIIDAVEIAAGATHTCVRRLDGGVSCWGYDEHGQLGDGLTHRFCTGPGLAFDCSPAPVAVSGMTDAVEVASGRAHSCARTSTGTVSCWGANDAGQLGDGTTQDRSVPTLVPGLVDAVQLALGTEHGCARRATGAVVCWGANVYRQLGDGTASGSLVPVAVAGIDDAIDLTVAGEHACVRRASGATFCWGGDAHGQLGDGVLAPSRDPIAAALGLTGIVGVTAGAVATLGFGSECPVGSRLYSPEICGNGLDDDCSGGADNGCDEHTCARLATGEVACWGANTNGQLGDGAHGSVVPYAQTIAGLSGATQVSVGDVHACARLATGELRCWGSGFSGQLGDGTTGVSRIALAPVAVTGVSDAIEVAAGSTHSCLRRADGTVACWGSNAQGQLGDGTTTDRLAPVDVVGIADAIDVGAAYAASCALRATGAVSCWGQLGASTPTPSDVVGITSAIVLSVGASHACVVSSDGTVACWGYGFDGSLGNGVYLPDTDEWLFDSSDAPYVQPGITDAIDVAAGTDHTCVAHASGAVTCWGMATQGQCGAGYAYDPTMPVDVPGFSGGALTAGRAVTCARETTGAVSCWGGFSDGAGLLGLGTYAGSYVPVMLPSPIDAIDLSAGRGASCAVRTGGTVACWGDNAAGELATGALGADRAVPHLVAGLP